MNSNPFTQQEEAQTWIYKLAITKGVPATAINEILDPKNRNHLNLLQGQKMRGLKTKIKAQFPFKGYKVSLKSGTKIHYISIPTILQRISQKKKLDPRGKKIILYWDGFKTFRTKGISTGKETVCFFIFFLNCFF